MVDDPDGEVLALGRNSIHSEESPLQHAEQHALRAAIARVHQKRPRDHSVTVEQYYLGQMFTAPGSQRSDFLRLGATCYTTLEPCPMCASALLVSRMKRVVFLLKDTAFGQAWPTLKHYYVRDESLYEQLSIDATASPFAGKCSDLLARLRTRTDALRPAGTRDTHLLDSCRTEVEEAAALLCSVSEADLATTGRDREANARLLSQLKQACNFPAPSL